MYVSFRLHNVRPERYHVFAFSICTCVNSTLMLICCIVLREPTDKHSKLLAFVRYVLSVHDT